MLHVQALDRSRSGSFEKRGPVLGVGSEIGVSRRDALARFEKASEIGRTRPAQEFGKILNELYENCLFSFELPVVEFSDLVLLLQLQRSLSAWIEQPWYQNPTGFRNAYLDIVQKDRSKRIEFIRTAIDAGNFEYRTAVSEVRRAFESGPMLSMSQLLMLAHHRFRAAWWFHRESVKMGGAPGEFEFSEISAEEGAVCTLTGISIGAMYCARPQAEHARNILYEGAPDLSSLRRSARRLATHIQPIFTRDFCDILAAQAMTLSPSTEAVKIGINELNTLHAKLSREVSDCEYERSWIDQALLSAYKKVSDDGATSRTATRIAGRLIIRRVL